MSDLFIPTKIRIGFQKREGTFTGKLAYIIYFDEKGKLRKETSWQSWRDKKIDFIDFENKPRNNYVLNKGVSRHGHWGSGRSVVRVYDPRDFEFEITIDNLIGILMHSDVSKRDIQEECLFAWAGTELVLLPVNSEEYQKSVKFTEKQSMKISAKNLIKGATYGKRKSDEEFVYLGYYDYYDDKGYGTLSGQVSKGKRHIFCRKYKENDYEFYIPSVNTLATVISDEPCEDYASMVESFFKSKYAKRITEIHTVPKRVVRKTTDYGYVYYYKKISSNAICTFSYATYYHTRDKISPSDMYINYTDFTFTNEGVEFKERSYTSSSSWYYSRPSRDTYPEYQEVLLAIKNKGLQQDNLTPDQLEDILVECGFGEIRYTNEDGASANPVDRNKMVFTMVPTEQQPEGVDNG